MNELTEEERKNTFLALEKFIIPNYEKVRKYKQKCQLECFLNLDTGYIEIYIDNHKHNVCVKNIEGKKYYYVYPYQKSYFQTFSQDNYEGFSTVLFALYELYYPIPQIKNNVLGI